MVKNYHYWNKIKNVDGTLLIYRIPTKLNIVFKQRSETNSIWTWKKLFLKKQ